MQERVSRSAAVTGALFLRAIVAALGERATPPWWRTQFLTEVGLRTMVKIFPRTGLCAAVKSVCKAACAEHDRRVGVGRYHLFRFPGHVEQAVRAVISVDSFGAQFAELLGRGQEGLLSKLGTLASGRPATPTEGPVELGDAGLLSEPETIAELAARYRLSLSSSRRSYPYFVERGGHR